MVAAPDATWLLIAGGPRGRRVNVEEALSRPQRYNVSKKDLTEDQRIENRWVSVLRSVI